MSGSHTMSTKIVSSEFYELVSDIKEEIVNSDDKHEITCGDPQEKQPQLERDSNSALEGEEFKWDTFQIQTGSVDDDVDIKYEVNGIELSSTSVPADDLDTESLYKKKLLNHGHDSMNSEEKELNQLYLDLLQCKPDCETCQRYIRKLSEHVRAAHAADQPTLDSLYIDPITTNESSANEIKCERQEDIVRMDCSEESDSNFEPEVEIGGDSDPEYNASPDLIRKYKSGQKPGKNHKLEKSCRKDEMVCQTEIPSRKKFFKCEECGKGFIKPSILTIHLRTHTGEKPFKCEECSKTFTRKDNLILHTKIHTGDKEKPFKCEECAKSFLRQYDLTRHMRFHTQDKPYECAMCSKCFKTKQESTVHRKTHKGLKPFMCDQCPGPRGYVRKHDLKIHVAKCHNGNKPFKK